MRTIIAAACAAGVVGMSVPAPAETTAGAAVATLSVIGQGEISRMPDMASVAVSIVTNDDSATRALSENNRRYAALGTKLSALGIGEHDLTSTSIQSYFNARPTGQPAAAGQLFGFVVTRNVQIDVAAMTQTGSVVDAATSAGATQVGGVTYGFRDRRAVERAALAAAVADAAAQAQAIAGAAHVQIVRILSIGNEAGPGRVMPMAMTMTRKADESVPTTIAPGELQIDRSISVTYVIR